MSDEWDLKILCMGAGYVGGPTMAVIAKMCPKVRILSIVNRFLGVDAPKSDMWGCGTLGRSCFVGDTARSLHCAINDSNRRRETLFPLTDN